MVKQNDSIQDKAGKDKEKASVGLYLSQLDGCRYSIGKATHVPVELIKNNIWNYPEILHKNLITTLKFLIFFPIPEPLIQKKVLK